MSVELYTDRVKEEVKASASSKVVFLQPATMADQQRSGAGARSNHHGWALIHYRLHCHPASESFSMQAKGKIDKTEAFIPLVWNTSAIVIKMQPASRLT